MAPDVFALASQSYPPSPVHNVRLMELKPNAIGEELLVVQYAGNEYELCSGAKYREPNPNVSIIGQIGYVCFESLWLSGVRGPGWLFRPYIDQSLRRMHELDLLHDVGWWCEARDGFRAPAGVIPGSGGAFVPDETVQTQLRVPKEFVQVATALQLHPDELLRSFIGDLCGLNNYLGCPRADGYSSNGSDERDYAQAWLDRAYGHQGIDLEAAMVPDVDLDDERWSLQDDINDLVDAFLKSGGDPEAIVDAVRKFVDDSQPGTTSGESSAV